MVMIRAVEWSWDSLFSTCLRDVVLVSSGQSLSGGTFRLATVSVFRVKAFFWDTRVGVRVYISVPLRSATSPDWQPYFRGQVDASVLQLHTFQLGLSTMYYANAFSSLAQASQEVPWSDALVHMCSWQ